MLNQLTISITTQLRMCNNQLLNLQRIQFNYVRKSHKPRLSGYTEHQLIKFIRPINTLTYNPIRNTQQMIKSPQY